MVTDHPTTSSIVALTFVVLTFAPGCPPPDLNGTTDPGTSSGEGMTMTGGPTGGQTGGTSTTTTNGPMTMTTTTTGSMTSSTTEPAPPCVSDSDCSDPEPVCDNNECVPCNALDDSYCTDNSQVCDTENKTCVTCLADGDCSDNLYCLEQECGPCKSQSEQQCKNANAEYCSGFGSAEFTCEKATSCSDLAEWGHEGGENFAATLEPEGGPGLISLHCQLDPNHPLGVGWTRLSWSDVWNLDPNQMAQDAKMVAVDPVPGNYSGITEQFGPYASHNNLFTDEGFSYYYTFGFSEFDQFHLEGYEFSFSNCFPNKCILGHDVGPDLWGDLAHDEGSAGTVVFGTSDGIYLNLATTDLKDEYMPGEVSVSDSMDIEAVYTTAPATSFRIGWGEYGTGPGTIEEIYVWVAGEIWLRRDPDE